jgi:hypothetical protein
VLRPEKHDFAAIQILRNSRVAYLPGIGICQKGNFSMSEKKTKNGLRRPLPGEQLPKYLQGCTTTDHVRAKLKTLNDRALAEAAKVRTANQQVRQAEQTLASQIKALVPMLREMQSILSQKSVLHYRFAELNLPTFTDWAKAFVAEAGIQASWSTIKLAMDPRRESPSLRSENHIPATKLQAQRVGYAALAGTELADALVSDRDPEDALGRLRSAGASRQDILDLLRRAGVKDAAKFSSSSTATNDLYSRSDSQYEESPVGGSDIRPGSYSQVENLLDRAVGPASRVALNVDDPTLQVAGFERIVSYWARKWLPFNSNLGTMEFTVRFVPKAKPELRREEEEAPALEGRALVATGRLLSVSQGTPEVNL